MRWNKSENRLEHTIPENEAQAVGPHIHQTPAADGGQTRGEIRQAGQTQLVTEELRQNPI